MTREKLTEKMKELTYEDLCKKYNELMEKYNLLINRYNDQSEFLARKCKENQNLIKEIVLLENVKRHREPFAEIEEPETEETETKSSKGFYVYNRSGSKPSYIHETLEAAKKEAERIFNLNLKSNIKEPLEVLEIVAKYTPKVTAEWE